MSVFGLGLRQWKLNRYRKSGQLWVTWPEATALCAHLTGLSRDGFLKWEEGVTGNSVSLKTRVKTEADQKVNAMNETERQPSISLGLAKVYLNG